LLVATPFSMTETPNIPLRRPSPGPAASGSQPFDDSLRWGARAAAATVLVIAACLLVVPLAARADDVEVQRLLALGDTAYTRRAEGAQGNVAQSGPIVEAVEAYAAAVELAPDRLDLRVRLLRALFFQGQYATSDVETKKLLFERGRLQFEESAELLSRRNGVEHGGDEVAVEALVLGLAREPDAGPLHYWGAVHWGVWGELFGNLAAVKKGVAKKVRDHGEVARQLAPDYDSGAPYRLLGRLHAVAPRVPIFTGWIDRELGLRYLEKALELGPDEPLHRAFLAEALLDHGPASAHERAMALLESAASAEPRAELAVEDAQAIADARKSLAARR
jgi:tetratricopeptide (TPR) repeat protein